LCRNSGASHPHKGAGWVSTLLVCCLILLAGAGITAIVFSTEPTAVRTEATRKTAMLVEVTAAERGTYRPEIVAMGTVEPARDIILRPRVQGEVVWLSGELVPGGFVQKGETLLRIDPSDFEIALQQRRSELQQALADLRIEMGRQEVAQKDYQQLGEELSSGNEALVLRKPQLQTARARVEAARAAVKRARLELERTRVRAPFDAHILRREVNLGSQVSAGDELARLVGIDTYWVGAAVPLSKLRWISFPGAERAEGSKVRIRNRSAWPEGEYREGRVYKLVGELENRTRMARVLVSVEDPLARRPRSGDAPALLVGSYVEARFLGRKIQGVVRLERDYVRQGDTVWVMRDGSLDIREAGIVFRDADYAYIRSGLDDGDRVVTTNLTTVVQGADLRTKGSGTGPDRKP
jgi:RND family efflux transporter MFP subunit